MNLSWRTIVPLYVLYFSIVTFVIRNQMVPEVLYGALTSLGTITLMTFALPKMFDAWMIDRAYKPWETGSWWNRFKERTFAKTITSVGQLESELAQYRIRELSGKPPKRKRVRVDDLTVWKLLFGENGDYYSQEKPGLDYNHWRNKKALEAQKDLQTLIETGWMTPMMQLRHICSLNVKTYQQNDDHTPEVLLEHLKRTLKDPRFNAKTFSFDEKLYINSEEAELFKNANPFFNLVKVLQRKTAKVIDTASNRVNTKETREEKQQFKRNRKLALMVLKNALNLNTEGQEILASLIEESPEIHQASLEDEFDDTVVKLTELTEMARELQQLTTV